MERPNAPGAFRNRSWVAGVAPSREIPAYSIPLSLMFRAISAVMSVPFVLSAILMPFSAGMAGEFPDIVPDQRFPPEKRISGTPAAAKSSMRASASVVDNSPVASRPGPDRE